MTKQPKKNLVICVVGDFSYHTHWPKRKKRNFDLMLVYYGETKDKYKDDADYYLQTKGLFKLENIAAGVNKYYDVLLGYDAIFMPDDDMRISTSSINRLFKIFHQYKLDLAQPTIGFGDIVHPIYKTVPGCILRYSNLVDIGCPIFKRQLLLEMLPLFTLNRSGYGINYVWSKKFKDKKIALIDGVALTHLKDIAKIKKRDPNYNKTLTESGINGMREMAAIMNQFNASDIKEIHQTIKFPYPVYFLKIFTFWLFIISNVSKRSLEILRHEGLTVFIEKVIDQAYFFSPKKFKSRIMIIYFKFRQLIFKIKNLNHSDDLDRLIDFTFRCGGDLIAPLQIHQEILTLLTLLDKIKPRFILEIGTQNGGSLFLLSQIASPDAAIISIDLSNGPFGGGYHKSRISLYKSFAKFKQKIHLMRDDSHQSETLKKVKTILAGNQLDFLFIDGDHTYDGVKKDFEMYGPLVKNDGLIAFHDIVPGLAEHVGGVPQFWQEIKSQYNTEEIVGDWRQGAAGIGLVSVDKNL